MLTSRMPCGSAISGSPRRLRQSPLARRAAAVAVPARAPVGPRVVAAVRQPVVEAERQPSRMMSAFVRSMSGAWIVSGRPSTPARVASAASCSNARDELRAAVGIARVVERVDADDDLRRRRATSAHPSASDRKIVLRAGHIGHRDVRRHRAADPSGTAMSSVSAEPPNRERSRSISTCRATPSARATARAASSSRA